MLAAIVFTDTVEFSLLMRQNEDRTLRLVARDLSLMKETCEGFGGRVLKNTGDGLLILFTSAVQAVACALEIQRNFQKQNLELPKVEQLQHRIGIHVGDVFQNGSDVMGDGVNVAARLQTEAVPGGICLSKTVYDVVANRLQFYVNDLGARQLKNIGSVTAYQISPIDPNSAGQVRTPWYQWRSLIPQVATWVLLALAVAAAFWLGFAHPWMKKPPAPASGTGITRPAPLGPMPIAPEAAPEAPPGAPAAASRQQFEMERFDFMRRYDYEGMRDWIAAHDWPGKGTEDFDHKVAEMQHLLRWTQEELHAYSSSDPLVITGPQGGKTEFWTVAFGGLRMKTSGESVSVIREQIAPLMFVQIVQQMLAEQPLSFDAKAQIESELAVFADYYNVKVLPPPVPHASHP
ncbi:MAG: adenylate/guanylate cyclase domain-containing protein [Verrucomicrobiota bacterium]